MWKVFIVSPSELTIYRSTFCRVTAVYLQRNIYFIFTCRNRNIIFFKHISRSSVRFRWRISLFPHSDPITWTFGHFSPHLIEASLWFPWRFASTEKKTSWVSLFPTFHKSPCFKAYHPELPCQQIIPPEMCISAAPPELEWAYCLVHSGVNFVPLL